MLNKIYIVSPSKKSLETLIRELDHIDSIRLGDTIEIIPGGVEAMIPKVVLCRTCRYLRLKFSSLLLRKRDLFVLEAQAQQNDIERIGIEIRQIRQNLGLRTKDLRRVHIADDTPEIEIIDGAREHKGVYLFRHIREQWYFDCSTKERGTPLVRKTNL